ncbi:MAG: hypothetical protein J6A33_01610 [Alphaproteobacteria bacterium]|nr:hypothetical protein [Alphaproteobacteria bacterium]
MDKKTFSSKAIAIAKSTLNFMANCGLGLLFIIVMVFVFAIFLVIYNPITFWVWALIAPASAAKSLRGKRGEKPDPVELTREFFWDLNRIFRFLLPWRCKKEFLAASQLDEATFEQELKFFRTSDQADIIDKNWLSKKAKDQVWLCYGNGIRALLLPHMGSLSLEQFSILVYNEEWSSVVKYLNTYTPSEKMLERIVKHAVEKKELKNNPALNLLCNIAQQRSLPANIINKLFKDKEFVEDMQSKVKTALSSYGQKQAILLGQKDTNTWRKFCNTLKDEEIFPENQILMSLPQYEEYHRVGKKLCTSAIIHFLSQGELSTAEKVIRYEIVENGAANDNIDCLISGNPKLVEILWRFRA